MRMSIAVSAVVIVSLLLPPVFVHSALAVTYYVAPDGSGDFPTIRDAIQACRYGDVIELGDGVFRGPGNRDLSYAGLQITIRSRGMDPTRCIIDCDGSSPGTAHRAFLFNSPCTRQSILEGVTIQHAYQTVGGAIRSESGDPTIRNCIFRENISTGEGAGVSVWGGAPLIQDCLFIDNSAPYGSAAAASMGSFYDPPTTFERCTFIGNTGGTEGTVRY